MIKTILVPLIASEIDDQSLTAAATVARAFSAHIDALYVRQDPVEIAVGMVSDASGSAGVLIPGLVEDLERRADERAASARQRFAQFCARQTLAVADAVTTSREASAQMHTETGQEGAWLLRYAITTDLVVVSRGNGGDSNLQPMLVTLLMDSGRPLLIPGSTVPATALDTVVMGWKATPQTARAVSSALPLLRQAKSVTAVTIAEADEANAEDNDRLLEYLRWHGVEAEIECIAAEDRDPVQELLDAAQRKSANLLVLGAYGHSRLREWAFGGFTREILMSAPLPVLFAH